MIAAVLSFVFISVFSHGLQLGELELKSKSPGERLVAHIPILDSGNVSVDSISVVIAGEAFFTSLGIVRSPLLDKLTFDIKQGKQGHFIEVGGSQILNKGYLIMLLEVAWPGGALLKEYAVLFGDQASLQIFARESLNGRSLLTRKNETLWRIASKTRPSRKVSVNQHMVAIQRLNPRAFIQGNMNLIKSGYRLVIPTETESLSLDAISAISIIKNQERQYSEIVSRSAGLIKKDVQRRSTLKGDVRIYSEDDEQVSEDVASSQLWDVRGPKLLKEKSTLDQRIKDLTQSYSEERLYTNRRLGEKDEQIEELNSRVNDLLAQLGGARAELKSKVPLLGSVLASVTSYFRGSGSLISYLIPGVVLFLLVLLFIRRQSVKRTKTEEVLEEESIELDLALKSAEGPSEPIISLNVPEDYDFESEEESYTASTKINLAKANIEIDKIQAAKDILKEVIDEGDVEEKKKAETLLKSIDEDPVK